MATPDIDTFLAAWAKDEYPPAPETLSAWKRLLSDPSIPASEIAKEAVSHFVKKQENDPDCTTIWRLLWDTVKQFTDHSDRLLDFLGELQKLPDCAGAFRKLPGMSEDMTEFVFDYIDRPFSDPNRNSKRQGWKNVNAFTAKMHVRGIRPNAIGELSRASWVLRKTLEKAPWEEFHHADIEYYIEDFDTDSEDEEYCSRRDEMLEEIDIRTLDGWVPAAAQWIIYCGKTIYDKEESWGGEWWIKTKWTGKEGWSKERWAFWKERFQWVGTVTALNRSTRTLAKEMVERMNMIEQGQ